MRDDRPTPDQDRPDRDDRWDVTRDPDGRGLPTRVWPRNLALALGAAGVTFLVLNAMQPAPAPAGDAAGQAAPSPTASDGWSNTPSSSASARPQIPLGRAFPTEVKAAGTVYTKVGAASLASCTEADSVGPRLIAMINSSSGCVGEQVALYKDKQNNQFNLAVFTMKDPQDTVRLVTELSMAFQDFEVGAQAPPPSSGLRTLPADSTMVQAFAGVGRSMVVGLGQWSDGRAVDLQALENRLKPLQDAVGQNVLAYETHH